MAHERYKSQSVQILPISLDNIYGEMSTPKSTTPGHIIRNNPKALFKEEIDFFLSKFLFVNLSKKSSK